MYTTSHSNFSLLNTDLNSRRHIHTFNQDCIQHKYCAISNRPHSRIRGGGGGGPDPRTSPLDPLNSVHSYDACFVQPDFCSTLSAMVEHYTQKIASNLPLSLSYCKIIKKIHWIYFTHKKF